MPTVPLADWTPDAAPFGTSGMQAAKNTYPRSDGADGPLKAQFNVSDALATQCKGAIATRATDGTTFFAAGTTTKLYVLSGASWTDKSGAATFAVPSTGHWQFAQFGDRLLATNFADEIQSWTIGGAGNFATLNAAAPLAKYIATVEPGFVVLGHYSDRSVVPTGLWWGAINDATSWPTPGTAAAQAAQSDNQQLASATGVTGIVPAIGGAQAVVFCADAIYRMEYVGGLIIFQIRPQEQGRGCIAPNSLARVGARAFFLSEDGFCVFDGVEVRRIGFGRVDRFFWATVDQAQLERVYAAVDFDKDCIVWAFPDSGASSGNPNRWLVYNYLTDRWRYGDDADLTITYMLPARTAGYTVETADTLVTNADANTTITVDSPVWAGGRRFFGGFSSTHRLVSFEGATLAARLETADASMDGRRVFVSGVRPNTDAASYTAGIGYRDLLSAAVSYTTPTLRSSATGICPQRLSTRFARARIDMAAGDTWTYLSGAEVDFRAEGRR